MRLEPVSGDDPRQALRALKAAIHGAGPAVGLGMPAEEPGAEVPAGTAVVVATSGSTGIPKRVVLSRDALISSALATAERVGEGAWLLALPASYVAGMQVLVRSIVADREPAVLAGRFTPQAFAAAALTMTSSNGGRRIPTFTSLVPAQVTMLLDAAESDDGVAAALRSFEAILVGGQAMPARLLQRAVSAGARVIRTYGSTETSGGCVYDGVPLDGVNMRVVAGEVQLSGPVLADGYLGDAPLTDAVFVRDAEGIRWYRTGDAGDIDSGTLRIRGRLDAVIVSGGINVSLGRVEQVVRSVAGLAEAVVVGVPDERWGEASVIVAARGAVSGAVLLEGARDAVAAAIGKPARPARIVLVAELPVLVSGKPDRAAIRGAVLATR